MESPGITRKLAAILSADVQCYSRLMGEDEEATDSYTYLLSGDPVVAY